jgi:hypothetical protein
VPLKRGTKGNESGALYIAAEDGKPERDKGVARAPSAQKGFGTESREGAEKKVWPTAWKFRNNAYLCSPQTRERDALRSADETGSLRKCSEKIEKTIRMIY